MALSIHEMDRVETVLAEPNRTGCAVAYCAEHLGQRVGLMSPEKIGDLRAFVRALRNMDAIYKVSEVGVCDIGAHAATDLVVCRRSPLPVVG